MHFWGPNCEAAMFMNATDKPNAYQSRSPNKRLPKPRDLH